MAPPPPPSDSDDELQAALAAKRQSELKKQQDLGAISPTAQPLSAEAVWGQVHQVQKDSLETTARALATAKGTETVGKASLAQLKAQGEQLERIHNRMIDAHEHAEHASSAADTLNAYTKLVPVQMQVKLSRRPVAQRITREATMEGDAAITTGVKSSSASGVGKAQEFEDETERQIARNLDDISTTLDSLGNIAQGMSQEVAKQDEVLDSTGRVVDSTSQAVAEAHKKTKKFLDS